MTTAPRAVRPRALDPLKKLRVVRSDAELLADDDVGEAARARGGPNVRGGGRRARGGRMFCLFHFFRMSYVSFRVCLRVCAMAYAAHTCGL